MKHPIALILLLVLALLGSCANPGSGPDGGPYDETPPRVVGMTAPQDAGRAGKKGTKIAIKFSEVVKLDNAQEKVIVSPPQMEQPEIVATGRRVNIHLLDTLRPNTTYTIDFSDAIQDATEGNPLGLFTYIFSTGETTDTMEVSGHVLNAEDLEPLKGVLVGLYPADAPDSVFRTQPLTRVARTDASGHFSIKGVANGEYRVMCLEDIDQDFRFSLKSELIGWARSTVRTSSFSDIRYDTAWIDTTRWSRIDTVQYTHYLPDDVVVLGFKERGQPRHRLKENREPIDRLNFFLTAPSSERPTVEGLNFDASCLRLEHSPGYDTLTYWICDTALVETDTLRLLFTYDQSDDSTGLRALTTDTLELLPRVSLQRRLKQRADEQAKWEKALEKRHKRGDYSRETPPPTLVKIEKRPPSKITPLDALELTFSEPLDTLLLSGVHLLLGNTDTTLTPAPFELLPRSDKLRSYTLRGEWRSGQNYRLRLDSACIVSAYGHVNGADEMRFSVQHNEDFGAVFIDIPDADTTAVVQLLNSSGKVVRQLTAENGRADFYYVRPDIYYYRCFLDRNGDGHWTTGDYTLQQQPEEVYYSPTRLDVKANFDFSQTWYIHSLPFTRQKPTTMVKQKKTKRTQGTAHERNVQRLKEKGRRP